MGRVACRVARGALDAILRVDVPLEGGEHNSALGRGQSAKIASSFSLIAVRVKPCGVLRSISHD